MNGQLSTSRADHPRGYASPNPSADNVTPPQNVVPAPPAAIEVAILTGGFDKPYALGLSMALASQAVSQDVIGSDQMDSPEMHTTPGVRFMNLQGSREDAGLTSKMLRVLIYYARLMWYAASSEAKIFHILWNNKFLYFDRTALMLYYKLLGKKIVLTAHNVNAGIRDSNDSPINRATLKIQYRLADHIFLHTEKMKQELLRDFGVRERAATVIPFGINNTVPNTDLTRAQARHRLDIAENETVSGACEMPRMAPVAADKRMTKGRRTHRTAVLVPIRYTSTPPTTNPAVVPTMARTMFWPVLRALERSTARVPKTTQKPCCTPLRWATSTARPRATAPLRLF